MARTLRTVVAAASVAAFVCLAVAAGCAGRTDAPWWERASPGMVATGQGLQAAAPATGPLSPIVWGIGVGVAALGSAWAGRRYERAVWTPPPPRPALTAPQPLPHVPPPAPLPAPTA